MTQLGLTSSRVAAGVFCLVASSLCFGCGQKETVPELVSVTGKVTYQGQPLADAFVAFIPADEEETPTELGRILRPAAQTDAQGEYELAWGDHVGAPPGKYHVTITKFKPSEDDEIKPDSLIPENYGSPKTSGLTRDVPEGDTVLDFDLR